MDREKHGEAGVFECDAACLQAIKAFSAKGEVGKRCIMGKDKVEGIQGVQKRKNQEIYPSVRRYVYIEDDKERQDPQVPARHGRDKDQEYGKKDCRKPEEKLPVHPGHDDHPQIDEDDREDRDVDPERGEIQGHLRQDGLLPVEKDIFHKAPAPERGGSSGSPQGGDKKPVHQCLPPAVPFFPENKKQGQYGKDVEFRAQRGSNQERGGNVPVPVP